MTIERSTKPKYAVMTCGGLAPGKPDVIRGAIEEARNRGIELVGLKDGWDSLLDASIPEVSFAPKDLDIERLRGRAGNELLRSTRTKIERFQYGIVRDVMDQREIDGIIIIGGDGTAEGAKNFAYTGIVPMIHVPKTVDNDVKGCTQTFGYSTARRNTSEAVKNMVAEAKATAGGGVAIVETMGRDNGWLALEGGSVGGADIILIPEVKVELDDFCKKVAEVLKNQEHVTVSVSEGVDYPEFSGMYEGETDANGNEKKGGIRDFLKNELIKRFPEMVGRIKTEEVGYRTRSTTPSTDDILLSEKLGGEAARLAFEGHWGTSITSQYGHIIGSTALYNTSTGNPVPKGFYDRERITAKKHPDKKNEAIVFPTNLSLEMAREIVKNDPDKIILPGGIPFPRAVVQGELEDETGKPQEHLWQKYFEDMISRES